MLRSLDVNGVRFQVADEGMGSAIVFVHGFPLDHSMWSEQIAEFSKTHRVIAPDLRGFGGSDGVLYTISMQQFADDLVELLSALEVDRPVTFCGLSMGGYIGWQFALRHPEWLGRLIICDSRAAADSPEAAANRLKMADIVTKDGPEPVVWAMMPKLFAAQTTERHPEITSRVRQVVMQTNPLTIAAAHRGMAIRPDVTAEISGITAPTLIVCGEHDAISPAAEMEAFAKLMPNSQYVQIPDSGHMSPMENPAAVNAALRDFLATA